MEPNSQLDVGVPPEEKDPRKALGWLKHRMQEVRGWLKHESKKTK